MIKKLVFIPIAALTFTLNIQAQKDIRYEQSQARVIEPLQDVYVRPLVVDLEIIKSQCQEYGPFQEFEYKDMSQITIADVEDAKKNAIYKAALIDNADVIVGATFHITDSKKGKGVDVTLRGYPAKYINWRKVGSDPKTDDYQWLGESLFKGQEVRVKTGMNDKAQAVEKNK